MLEGLHVGLRCQFFRGVLSIVNSCFIHCTYKALFFFISGLGEYFHPKGYCLTSQNISDATYIVNITLVNL